MISLNNNYWLNLRINQNFIKNAHKGANDATLSVGAASVCQNVTGNDDEDQNCPLDTGREAWVVHLEKTQDGSYNNQRTYRKASASPTLFKGKVYFPVYQPPIGLNRCNQGHAFICATDDECGTNNADALNLAIPDDLTDEVANPNNNRCAYVREGILSELVIFSDKLFANVAGPSDDASTLFSILSIPGDVISNRGGW